MALCGIIKHHNKNEKPCVLGFWHFLTSERIAGFSACLSAEYETILCYAGFFSFVFQLCTYLNFSQNFSVFSQKFFS